MMQIQAEKEINQYEVMEEYLDAKEFYSFEGERGVNRLEELAEDLGYKGDGFKYGSPIESLLMDNPGCIETIIEWIRDNLTEEQMENLQSHT